MKRQQFFKFSFFSSSLCEPPKTHNTLLSVLVFYQLYGFSQASSSSFLLLFNCYCYYDYDNHFYLFNIWLLFRTRSFHPYTWALCSIDIFLFVWFHDKVLGEKFFFTFFFFVFPLYSYSFNFYSFFLFFFSLIFQFLLSIFPFFNFLFIFFLIFLYLFLQNFPECSTFLESFQTNFFFIYFFNSF